MGAGLSVAFLSESGKAALLDAYAGRFGHKLGAYRELMSLGAIEGDKREGFKLTAKGREMAGKVYATRTRR